MTNLVLQPITTHEPLPEFFGQILLRTLREILPHLKVEILRKLHFVCRLLYKKTYPYLCYTIPYITDTPEVEPNLSEIYATQGKCLYPFLYPQVVLVKPVQSLELFQPEHPVLAIVTTDGTIPIGIDTSQLRRIVHSSEERISLGYGSCDIFDFLNHYHKELPNFVALTIHNAEIDAEAMYGCEPNLGLKYLNLAGSKVTEYHDDCSNGRREYYPLTSLKYLVTTIAVVDETFIDVPECVNLETCIMFFPETDDPGPIEYSNYLMKCFEADKYKLLNHWELLCDSPTRICHFNFGLPNTDCLSLFICNATSAQATFIVYGIRDNRGKFIKQAPHNWFSNLNYIMVCEDFHWWLEVSEKEFRKCTFEDVILKQDVEIKYYYLEIEDDEPMNAEK